MNLPDGELPENWQGKFKDDGTRSSVRRLWLAVSLLILLLGIGVSVGILRPDLLGSLFPNVGQTQTADALHIQQTQQALQATAQANNQRGTQSALNLQGTQSALDATQAAYNQAATQSALDAIAARTVTVQAIQQRATSDALELQGTQAALNLSGTQAGLDVQSTLAALQGSNPTQVIVDPALATPTPTISGTTSTIDDNFSSGISPGVWTFGAGDWIEQGTGLLASASTDRSRLGTQRTDFTNYTLDIWFVLSSVAGDMTLSHLGADHNNWVVIVRSDGTKITEVMLTFVENGITQTILSMAYVTNSGFSNTYHAHLELSPNQYTIRLNDELLIDMPMNGLTAGAVSITVPSGTLLSRVVITDR